jgi:tungstate transport system substrate-binding protein
MRATLILLLAVAFGGCSEDAAKEPTRLRLATTTSTYNSGLLDAILPPFEKAENIEIQIISVGTGQALALGERGDADILLVHARAREDAFVAAGNGVDRRDIMWNDFVIVGPPDDPAGVRGMEDAAQALKKIRDARATFVSRGDDSGTHIRERSLWKNAGGTPQGAAWYLEAGQGMGKCLIIADEKEAYILADRGTYLAYKPKIDLRVLVEGDPALRNPYGAMLVNPEKHPDVAVGAARKLLDYLTSEEGRKRIADFRKEGEVLFHPAGAKG